MKAKSSAKVSSKSTTARTAKSAPKAEPTADVSIPTMDTRLAPSTTMEPKKLLAAMRGRITPDVRSSLEAQIAAEPNGLNGVGMPVSVFTSEAIIAAVRVEWHQVPREGLPMSLEPHKKRLGGDVGPEIVYLVDQVRIADSMVAQGRVPVTDTVIERAQYVLARIRSGVEIVVDDGVRDGKDTLVESLRREHESAPANIPALASALAAYVDVGRVLQSDLADLAGFDLALLDEGAETADILSARKTVPKNGGARAAVLRRGRLLKLIRDRLGKVRKIARFTFGEHPDTAREFLSAYLRDKRRAQKRDASAEEVDELVREPGEDADDDVPDPQPAPNDDPV